MSDQLVHWELILGGPTVWWIFSTLVDTMPEPLPLERWYKWLYNFLQLIAANRHNMV